MPARNSPRSQPTPPPRPTLPVARRAVDPAHLLALGFLREDGVAAFEKYLASLERFRSRFGSGSARSVVDEALSAADEAARAKEAARRCAAQAHALVQKLPDQVDAWLGNLLALNVFEDVRVLLTAEAFSEFTSLADAVRNEAQRLREEASSWELHPEPALARVHALQQRMRDLEVRLDGIRRDLCLPLHE